MWVHDFASLGITNSFAHTLFLKYKWVPIEIFVFATVTDKRLFLVLLLSNPYSLTSVKTCQFR